MKRRRLSPGDDALWKRATRDVRPLDARPLPASPSAPPLGLPLGETTREAMTPVSAAAPSARKRAPKCASVFAAGDPGVERRVKRGRIAIERTLDLHGLREAAARVRLEAFVTKAARAGCHCVLVVTGKGRAGAIEDDPFANERPRGVIKRRFQDWVEEEPLRSLIVRAAPAQPKDGGAGAFYLFLKMRSARL